VVVDVIVQDPRWSRLIENPAALCRQTALAALDAAGCAPDRLAPDRLAPDQRTGVELSIVLANDATLRALNRDYRGKDKPTNVLSFAAQEGAPAPAGGGPLMLGDVIVACETAQREAAAESKPIADHLRHLIVHGLLHLLGHDHEQPDEAEEMEGLERRVLAGFDVPDPYAPKGPGPRKAKV
jgi:probable rRNA maturation factor